MEDRNMKTGWIHAEENNTNVRFAPKTMVSEVLISENGPDLMTALNQMLLEKCYPVGAVYLSAEPGSGSKTKPWLPWVTRRQPETVCPIVHQANWSVSLYTHGNGSADAE